MAARGVNGASQTTLNDRFLKCAGCNVNIPKEDMTRYKKCTICNAEWTLSAQAHYTNYQSDVKQTKTKFVSKRWVTLVSNRGREYYHNTETGHDQWHKPADLEAEAEEDHFVPFKNDAVKEAILHEQAKLDAIKLGAPYIAERDT